MNKKAKDIIFEHLSKLRISMEKKAIDACIVRITDNYLSEYIPLAENDVLYFSGFSGSSANMLITMDNAFLFVDGRYHAQAGLEVPKSLVDVVKVPLDNNSEVMLLDKLKGLYFGSKRFTISMDSRKLSYLSYMRLKKGLRGYSVRFIDNRNSVIKRHSSENTKELPEKVAISIIGSSISEKLSHIDDWLNRVGYDFFLVSTLDDLSYFTGLRSYEIPYSSSFRGICLLGLNKKALFVSYDSCDWFRKEFKGYLDVYLEKDFYSIVKNIINSYSKDISIGFDKNKTSYYRVKQLLDIVGDKSCIRHIDSPLSYMKAIKTSNELSHMSKSFATADKIMNSTIDWINDSVNSGDRLSEKDISDKVKSLFLFYGARGLSFEVISACDQNSAIIHYTNPDPNRVLELGDLMLLDIGAYFEGGYATDLTRTFLVGGYKTKATDKQKEIYSLVLKAAIRLMKAIFPKGTRGFQLDAIVRSTLWDYGYTYNHGTGHGIGISVHESPPRVSNVSDDVIDKGMVFSVEPGIYIDGFGGVRIENIVTTVEADNDGWLKIKPLTFAKLDSNLIDKSYFDNAEVEWLYKYTNASINL